MIRDRGQPIGDAAYWCCSATEHSATNHDEDDDNHHHHHDYHYSRLSSRFRPESEYHIIFDDYLPTLSRSRWLRDFGAKPLATRCMQTLDFFWKTDTPDKGPGQEARAAIVCKTTLSWGTTLLRKPIGQVRFLSLLASASSLKYFMQRYPSRSHGSRYLIESLKGWRTARAKATDEAVCFNRYESTTKSLPQTPSANTFFLSTFCSTM